MGFRGNKRDGVKSGSNLKCETIFCFQFGVPLLALIDLQRRLALSTIPDVASIGGKQ